MFSYRVFKTSNDTLLAVADAALLGKELKEGNHKIMVSDFYRGELCGAETIRKLVKSATIINIMGENAVSLFVKENIVKKENILLIGGVPHAQVINV
ncbi:MAG: DUF424 family protein [Candidatus Aenigmarchaeota archaeon]|nr:DUF424 family protein [Candidatus Aenigmarchaeota archaeon]